MQKAVSDVRVVRQHRSIVEPAFALRKGQDIQLICSGPSVESVLVAGPITVEDFVAAIIGMLQSCQAQQ